jgi:hypothetical protein
MKNKCDLIKLSTTVTIAPFWLWTRGSTEPPFHVELVETSRWKVAIIYSRVQISPFERSQITPHHVNRSFVDLSYKCKRYKSMPRTITSESDDDLEAGVNEDEKAERERAAMIVPYLAARTYHIPGNNLFQDWFQYVYANNHPVFGLCFHYKYHPVSNSTRILVFFGTLCASLAIFNLFYLFFLWKDGEHKQHDIPTDIALIEGNEYLTLSSVEFENWQLYLWTLGALMNTMFDISIWTLAACSICAPGGRLAHMTDQRWLSRLLVLFVVFVTAALAVFLVVVRAAVGAESGTDIQELQSAGLSDDKVDFGNVGTPQEYFYLRAWIVQYTLTLFVYDIIIATVLFSGILGCGGELPILGGRPYELKKESQEKENAEKKLIKSTRRSVAPVNDVDGRRRSLKETRRSVSAKDGPRKSKRSSISASLSDDGKKQRRMSKARSSSRSIASGDRKKSQLASVASSGLNPYAKKEAVSASFRESERKRRSSTTTSADGKKEKCRSVASDDLRKSQVATTTSADGKMKKRRSVAPDDLRKSQLASVAASGLNPYAKKEAVSASFREREKKRRSSTTVSADGKKEKCRSVASDDLRKSQVATTTCADGKTKKRRSVAPDDLRKSQLPSVAASGLNPYAKKEALSVSLRESEKKGRSSTTTSADSKKKKKKSSKKSSKTSSTKSSEKVRRKSTLDAIEEA